MEQNMFFIINTWGQWEAAETAVNIEISGEGISLEKASGYVYGDTLTTGAAPQSLALDACGTLYMTGQSSGGRIVIYDPQTRDSRPMKCITFENPVSIAVTGRDIHVVDGRGNGGQWTVYSLARVNGQVRRVHPVDEGTVITALENHGLYLLDTLDKRIFTVPLDWETEPEEIVPLDGNGAPYPFDQPTDIASDSRGNFYILEAQKREILAFGPGGEIIAVIAIPFEKGSLFSCLAASGENSLYLGFTDETGEETVSGIVQLSQSVSHQSGGRYSTGVFDSTAPGCLWHRVVLDADIPANTRAQGRAVEHGDHVAAIGHLHGRRVRVAVHRNHFAAKPHQFDDDFLAEFATAKKHHPGGVRGEGSANRCHCIFPFSQFSCCPV